MWSELEPCEEGRTQKIRTRALGGGRADSKQRAVSKARLQPKERVCGEEVADKKWCHKGVPCGTLP